MKACCIAAFAVVLLPRPALEQNAESDAINAILTADTQAADQAQARVLPAAKQPAVEARAPEPAVLKPAPEELYLSKDPQPTFTAETVDLTEEAARKYLAIVEAGGWPVMLPLNQAILLTPRSKPQLNIIKTEWA